MQHERKIRKNVLCDSTREKRGRSGTFASLKGYSQPSFFTLFPYIPVFRCFFTAESLSLLEKCGFLNSSVLKNIQKSAPAL